MIFKFTNTRPSLNVNLSTHEINLRFGIKTTTTTNLSICKDTKIGTEFLYSWSLTQISLSLSLSLSLCLSLCVSLSRSLSLSLVCVCVCVFLCGGNWAFCQLYECQCQWRNVKNISGHMRVNVLIW